VNARQRGVSTDISCHQYLKQVGDFAGVLSALQQMTMTSPGGLLKAISAIGGAMRMG
jgi:hypothetical protein